MTTRLQIDMIVYQDWKSGARRVLTLEGESLEELGALAVEIAPGLAALARKVIAATGSESTIDYRPLPADDPTQRQPVIEMARRHLGWEPGIALDQGLPPTVAYFRALLAG